ncbi:tumor necrosis factor-inducible gene 6 protein-like [Montipora capricornis]|uniref:tumor necrosis factor-inducible gene 6 protein-like n=1 Tax=Montipora capricornis TaxID=246305 RepID=UPI0035F17853
MALKSFLILAVCAFLVNLPNAASDIVDCGYVEDDNLKSPGWENQSYPSDIDNCFYSVSIPPGKEMVVYFHFFELEYDSSCEKTFLHISGDSGQFKSFCGNYSGETFLVKGYYVNINLFTESSVTGRGFDLYFVPVDPLPASLTLKKRTYMKKRLNIHSDDKAKDRRIKEAIKDFLKTRLMKEHNYERAEFDSLKHKKYY